MTVGEPGCSERGRVRASDGARRTWALALIAAAGCGGAPHQVTTLATAPNGELHDGTLAGMALPASIAEPGEDARGWIAQGRVRAAIRLSDGQRIDAENAEFRAATGEPELLAALALDETGHELYTLSERALYREDLEGSQPVNQVARVLALDPPLLSDEVLLDVRPIPGTQRVVVLTTFRLVVLASEASGLSVVSQCLDLRSRQEGAGPHCLVSSDDPHFDELQVDRFVALDVTLEPSGAARACVLANMGRYEHYVHGSVPLLLLCDLDAEHGYAHPTFDVEPAPAVGFAYWNPFDSEPVFSGTDANGIHHNSLRGLAVQSGADGTDVYLACGRQKQLRRVHAVFAPQGVEERATIVLDPLQDLDLALCPPAAPGHLYVRGSYAVFDVDLGARPPNWTALWDQPFPEGAIGGPASVRIATGTGRSSTFWTMGAGPLLHNVQCYDVSTPGPAPGLGLDLIWVSDGGVALDPEDTYLLTGGGVRHYRFDGVRWLQRGYAASQDSLAHPGPAQGFAEQLELAAIAPGVQRLVAPLNTSAASGLVEWPLDGERDPLPARFYPIPRTPTFSGWDPGDQMYTDDVAFVAAGSERYALLCPTRIPGDEFGARETALVVFHWQTDRWELACSARAPLAAGLANTIALGELESGGEAAFVASDAGLVSYALHGLAEGQPVVALASLVPGEVCFGVGASGSRLIAAYTHGPAPHYALYDWDRATGAILGSSARTWTKSALGVPATYGRTFRLRLDPLAGEDAEVYDCNDAGQVFRLHYRAAGEGSLECDARWRSLDRNVIQDCRVYTFGGVKRLLVTKDRESFAWVIP